MAVSPADQERPSTGEKGLPTSEKSFSTGEKGLPANEESLKLTSYFGERDRADGRLVADALLDLYERHEIQSGILLRGAQGFGLEHHLRTDRLLTLSEDLPVVSVAVDTHERIEAMLGGVLEIKRRGLLTLERARTLRAFGQADAADAAGTADTTEGQASKLTVYLGRHERVAGRPAFAAVCDMLHQQGVAGATVLLGVDGTRRGERKRARFFAGNGEVPMMIVAIGERARIAGVTARLGELLQDPLATMERVRVCKRDGELISTPHESRGTDEHGLTLWQKLTVVSSEAARYEGNAVHLELIRRLRGAGAAGATSLRGIWGFHGDHPPHGDKLLSLRRHVPIMTIIIDTPERVRRSFPIVDELTRERGLVTSEIVPAMTAQAHGERRGGVRLAAKRQR
jgi:PII-like signaling protein